MVSPTVAGVLGFVFLLLLMALNIPLAFAFAILGIAGTIYVGGIGSLSAVLTTVPYTYGSYYVLVTVPLFILMGQFAYQSGISSDLYRTAYKWLGRLPGGLALATMAACTAFAACTGSSVASAAAMGTVSLPEMKKYGYANSLATATVAIGGTLGILIPPSTTFIIYGVLTEESIGKLFIAGIVPGLMLSGMYMALIYITALRYPAIAPRGEATPLKERILSLKGSSGMLILFLLVMGGIWLGVFTPTEAAGIGAFGAFVLALFRRKLSRHVLNDSLNDSVRTTCMTLAIVIGAMIFNYFLVITNLPMDLAEWVSNLPVPGYAIIAVIILIYVPLGMFMDTLAMVILTIPIFHPVVTGLGFDGIWFGVLVVIMAEIGLVTPPVGMNCFVIAGVAKEVPLSDIFRGIIPFVAVALVGVALIAAFPQISLWLPGAMLR